MRGEALRVLVGTDVGLQVVEMAEGREGRWGANDGGGEGRKVGCKRWRLEACLRRALHEHYKSTTKGTTTPSPLTRPSRHALPSHLQQLVVCVVDARHHQGGAEGQLLVLVEEVVGVAAVQWLGRRYNVAVHVIKSYTACGHLPVLVKGVVGVAAVQ